MNRVTLIEHPLIQHNLARLRDRRTEREEFRRVVGGLTTLLVYEATRSFRTKAVRIKTPMEATQARVLVRPVLVVPILRAGLGMLESVLQLLPQARVGFVGIRRDEETLGPSVYHESLPRSLGEYEVLVLDPMLATGGSAVAALDLLVQQRARHLRLVSLLAAPEGLAHVHQSYPRVPVFTAAIDRKLNQKGYILPGLGDAGDRLFAV